MSRSTLMLLALLCLPGSLTAQTLPDLSGTWLQRQVTTSLAKVPVVGKVTSTSEAFVMVKIKQSGAKLDIETKTCTVELTSEIKKVRAYIPMKFLQLMEHKRKGSLVVKEGKVVFRQHLAIDVFGAKLRDKKKGVMPTEKKDKTVVDQDKDEHPGVTVRTRGLIKGKIYVAQRNWTTLSGVVAGDEIVGNVTWKTEQHVLGASSVFLKKDPNAKPHPDASKSHFKMVRAKNANTCGEALAFRKKL